jgi:hypothetical protein
MTEEVQTMESEDAQVVTRQSRHVTLIISRVRVTTDPGDTLDAERRDIYSTFCGN